MTTENAATNLDGTAQTPRSTTIADAANRLGCSPRTVSRMIDAGTLRVYRSPGRNPVVSVEDVEAELERRRAAVE